MSGECIGETLFTPLFAVTGALLFIGDIFSRRIFREIKTHNPKLCEAITEGYSPEHLLGPSRTLISGPMMMNLMRAIFQRKDTTIVSKRRWLIFLVIYTFAVISLISMLATLMWCLFR
jgi:hypothetical protein